MNAIRRLAAVAFATIFAACAGSQQELRATPGSRIPQTRTTGIERVIYSFGTQPSGSDGEYPWAGLINDGGTLYGTTAFGGDTACRTPSGSGCGVVFSIKPASGQENVLYAFTGISSRDGASPSAPLVNVNGTLYGTTQYGGIRGRYDNTGSGTVFSVTRSGKETVLHRFVDDLDGTRPMAALINVKGTLYGTTWSGGAHDVGTVYKIASTGSESVLYWFKGGSYGDGENPAASLVNVHDELYGTTAYGGAGCGTVFKTSLSGKEKVLYRFEPYNNDACDPEAGLVELGGVLYGTTRFGGKHSGGTVFSITISGKERVIHSFTYAGSTDGSDPEANLIAVNGTLYGTTFNGGASGAGTVFSIEPSGKERIIYSFGAQPDGQDPVASLIKVNGTLFGTTLHGGAAGYGSVFSIPISK